MDASKIKEIVFVLMMAADAYFGTKHGAEKKEQVISWFYELLPDIVTKFISREELGNTIESLMDKLKATVATA